jgi:co-chaperonin GroES (HSP10)
MSQTTRALGEGLFPAGGSVKFTHEIQSIKPLHDTVLVRDMEFQERTLSSGIILPNDDGKANGIRPRWAQVYAVGPEQTDIAPGQWIMVEHGRWSRGVNVKVQDQDEFTLRRVDPSSIIFVSDDAPDQDDTISTAVIESKKER